MPTVTNSRSAYPAVDRSNETAKRAHGPKVVIPNREYFLFHGAASDLGNWGIGRGVSNEDKSNVLNPAFIWPADYAWGNSNDVDPHWAGVGASIAAAPQLVQERDPR